VRALGVVLLHTSIEIGLEVIERRIEPFTEGDARALVE
jgi:hypothetical protein